MSKENKIKRIRPKKSLIKKILLGFSVVVVILLGAFLIFVNDYYKASDDVAIIIANSSNQMKHNGNYTIIHPLQSKDKNIGIVFYPGGKVEDDAYIPLLFQLADEGVTSVLVEMPFNLAVFNSNAASKAITLVPSVEKWHLMGHSLGGAMASSFINKNSDDFEGLVLLAAYPINEADIDTLQIYGSNDLVLDQSKIDKSVPYYIIDGGNHAYFGNYGEQDGDGEATLSREEQQAQTVEEILLFMGIIEQE